jgi:hypothetical protein
MIDDYEVRTVKVSKIIARIMPSKQTEFDKLLLANPKVDKEKIICHLVNIEGMDESKTNDIRASVYAILPNSDIWPGR